MIHIELLNLLDARQFVVHEYFQVDITQQVQIDLVPVISDRHYKRSILVKKIDLL
jgi:uncharacterized protein with HEPN domain